MPASTARDSRVGGGTRARARRRLLVVGGCDVHLRIDLMRALSDRYEVSAAGSECSLRPLFEEAGFDYHLYPLSRGGSPVLDLVSMRRLGALCRGLKPDVVHAFATKPSVWGRIAAHGAGVPTIVGTIPGLGSLYARSTPVAMATRRVYESLQKFASSRSNMTIFQNRQDLEQFRAAGVVGEDRSTVVQGSGVRTEYFDPARVADRERERTRRDLGIPPGPLVTVMVSRVIRTKGVLEFAAAAEALKPRFPAVEFVLVGPIDRESIDRLTAAEVARLGRAVRCVGPRSDVRSILAVADVFALPTYYREGIPRGLLEAASMALPLVATHAPGCSDVVEDAVNGYLVAPRDPESLTRSIAALLTDADVRSRFGAASRRLAREKFDLSVIAREISVLYDTCSASRSTE